MRRSRITIRLGESLLTDVKQYAASKGESLTSIIEGALSDMLARTRPVGKQEPFEMVTFRGEGGLKPGSDLDDSAGLLDFMENHKWRDSARR